MRSYQKKLHEATVNIPLTEVHTLSLIADPQGNILLIRDSGDVYWRLPGGCHEPGESLSATVFRRIVDATGILLKNPHLLRICSNPEQTYIDEDGHRIYPIYMLFSIEAYSGKIKKYQPYDTEIRFFAPCNILPDSIYPPMRNILFLCLENLSGDISAFSGEHAYYPNICD